MRRSPLLPAALLALGVCACGQNQPGGLPPTADQASGQNADQNAAEGGGVVGEEAIVGDEPRLAVQGENIGCSAYDRLDRDGDRRITRAEYDGFRGAAFSEWDPNRDGRISREEFQRCWSAGGFREGGEVNADAVFAAFDGNQDNDLAQDEFFRGQAFETWDANRDGAVTQDEAP